MESYPNPLLRKPPLKARGDEKKIFDNIKSGRHGAPAYQNVECRFPDADAMVQELGRNRFGNEQVARKGDKGHYEPGNIEWKTREENKRDYTRKEVNDAKEYS